MELRKSLAKEGLDSYMNLQHQKYQINTDWQEPGNTICIMRGYDLMVDRWVGGWVGR